MMDVAKTNEKLLKVQAAWYQALAEDWCSQNPDQTYSAPFCCGISFSMSDPTKKTIMIIGQEARNWHTFIENHPLKFMQDEGIRCFEEQFGLRDGAYKINSPFWRWFKRFQECNIVWNNLDKLHRYVQKDDAEAGETRYLRLKDEMHLSQPFSLEGDAPRSLLVREIDMIEPDIVLFVTGPSYFKSMALALGMDASVLKMHKPTDENLVSNISELVNAISYKSKKIPRVIWTYHPNHLNYMKGATEKAEQEMKRFL